MDKTTLVERDIRDGEELIRKLDQSDFQVHSSLWFFNSDAEQWRLILASPLADSLGLKEAYTTVNAAINGMEPPFGIELYHISVVSPSDWLIITLSGAIQTPADAIAGIRFSKNTIGNRFIEDAYIYRLQPTVSNTR